MRNLHNAEVGMTGSMLLKIRTLAQIQLETVSARLWVKSTDSLRRSIRRVKNESSSSFYRHCRRIAKEVNKSDNPEQMVSAVMSDKALAQWLHYSHMERASLAQAMILCSDLFLASIIETARDLTKKNLRKLGPTINSVPWAQALEAAGNYVRHQHEWEAPPLEFGGPGKIRFRGGDPCRNMSNGKQRKNAAILVRLGIKMENVLIEKRNVSCELAEKLELLVGRSFTKLFDEWFLELITLAKTGR